MFERTRVDNGIELIVLDFLLPDRAVVTSGPEQHASIEFIRAADGTVQWVRVTGRIARRVRATP